MQHGNHPTSPVLWRRPKEEGQLQFFSLKCPARVLRWAPSSDEERLLCLEHNGQPGERMPQATRVGHQTWASRVPKGLHWLGLGLALGLAPEVSRRRLDQLQRHDPWQNTTGGTDALHQEHLHCRQANVRDRRRGPGLTGGSRMPYGPQMPPPEFKRCLHFLTRIVFVKSEILITHGNHGMSRLLTVSLMPMRHCLTVGKSSWLWFLNDTIPYQNAFYHYNF